MLLRGLSSTDWLLCTRSITSMFSVCFDACSDVMCCIFASTKTYSDHPVHSKKSQSSKKHSNHRSNILHRLHRKFPTPFSKFDECFRFEVVFTLFVKFIQTILNDTCKRNVKMIAEFAYICPFHSSTFASFAVSSDFTFETATSFSRMRWMLRSSFATI